MNFTEEPDATWKGYLCMIWVKERVITGYFFGSYDTVDSMSVQTISPVECQRMVETKECAGNKMVEISPKTFSYKASPNSEGTWMQRITFIVRNCVLEEITLKKDCRNCPITYPFGILTNNSDASSMITHGFTIIWTSPTMLEDERCALKKEHNGTGLTTKISKNHFKLIDEVNQLEFKYTDEVIKFCNHTFYKLSNIKNAFIQFPKKENDTWTLLYNKANKKCLDYIKLSLVECKNVETQKF